jgi:hypothetical protein
MDRARPRPTGNGPDVARVPLGRPAAVENAAPGARSDSVSNPSDVSTPSSVAHVGVGSSAPIRAESAAPERLHTASASHTKPHTIARVQNRRHKDASERVAGVTLGMDSGFGSFGRAYDRDPSYPRTGFWDRSR